MDSADWIASKLTEGRAVISCAKIATGRLWVERRDDLSSVVIAAFSLKRLDRTHLEPLLSEQPSPQFVVNIPKDAVINGSAYGWADENDKGIGGFGDLRRALSLPDVTRYEHRDIVYIERILMQHDAVAGFGRLDNRRYRIDRRRANPIIAVFLDDYELTAESLRNARARFDRFEEVVLSNPMGTATGEAADAAATMGAVIYPFKEFLGRLNRP